MLKNKILIITAMSLFAFGANAEIVETGTCNQAKTCKYELDSEGNLRVFGTGEIKYYRFYHRSDIVNVVIEKGITSVEEGAFSNNPNIESVELPKTLTSIGTAAFAGIGKLRNITIPKLVTSIPSRTFTYTPLMNITIEGANVSIGDTDAMNYGFVFGKVNYNVVPGSETEKRLKELYAHWSSNAIYTAYIPPKRTSYTIEEAMQHVSHDNKNRVIFTFK